jgi:hypothetical protein
MIEHKPTQNQRILDYIEEHGGITQREADDYLAITRLPSRIFDSRDQGYNIVGEWVKGKNRFGEPVRVKRYRLVDAE